MRPGAIQIAKLPVLAPKGRKEENDTKARAPSEKLDGKAQFGKRTHAPQGETVVTAGTTMKSP
jgi:hypothetical protein